MALEAEAAGKILNGASFLHFRIKSSAGEAEDLPGRNGLLAGRRRENGGGRGI